MHWKIHHHVTTRDGGVSTGSFASLNLAYHVGDTTQAVTENRLRLATLLGYKTDHIIWMNQTHSNRIGFVEQPQNYPVNNVDALVTTQTDLVLAVMTADCVPVLISDVTQGIIAAVHAGRQGAITGVITHTIDTLLSLGSRKDNMNIFIGPAISGSHYELPASKVKEVEKFLPHSQTTTVFGTPGVDLRAGIINQLQDKGIDHITVDHRCTVTDKRLFSYRRDGSTGRFASLIWMTTEK